MRKLLVALALAAGTLGLSSTASEARYYYGYGYGYHAPRYVQPIGCRWKTVKVWSAYYHRYIYKRTRVCW